MPALNVMIRTRLRESSKEGELFGWILRTTSHRPFAKLTQASWVVNNDNTCMRKPPLELARLIRAHPKTVVFEFTLSAISNQLSAKNKSYQQIKLNAYGLQLTAPSRNV
jgi:hypothetical protein